MLAHFVHLQYCYVYLVNQIPMGLLLYAHIPTGIAALLFGSYVLYKARDLMSALLFFICASFFFWCLFDLSAWFAFLGADNMMFTWSSLDFLAVLMFFYTYYFLYVFVMRRDLPTWQKIAGVCVMVPTAIVTILGINLGHYDANVCAAIEISAYTRFTYISEAIIIAATLVMGISVYIRTKDIAMRRQNAIASVGVLIFLLFFFSATFLVSILADSDASTYVYNYLIYGLFGMPVFLAYFGYLIVRYHTFDIKVIGAQALIVTLVAILAAELAFAASLTNLVLIAVTLVITLAVGAILVRSVRKEIAQREQIQQQELELEQANRQQESLLHFISHEVKGYLTKNQAAFAAISAGDFGDTTPELKQMSDSALVDTRKGVATVIDILDASNLKSGTVSYDKKPFDLAAAVDLVVHDLEKTAHDKNLELKFAKPVTGAFTVKGDEDKFSHHVLRNLIDNSIKYTPTGSVIVDLTRDDKRIRLTITDTGVGITSEDKQRLFTEGGRGKDSVKVNVNSTGYGLYIAKQVVEAHGGKIWAESDGAGKGSRFIVELPISA